MASHRVLLAALVQAEIERTPWSVPITPVGRAYVPIYDTRLGVSRQVTVVPGELSQARHPGRSARGGAGGIVTDDISVDLCLQHKLSSLDNAEIDPLCELLEEISDHFRRLGPLDNYYYLKADSMLGDDHFRGKLVFTGLLTLTYRWTGE